MRFPITWFHTHRTLNERLYLALILISFGGYIAFSLFQEHTRIETQERARLAIQARVVAENLARQLNSSNLALTSILKEIPDWRKRKDVARLAAQHMKALKDAMPGVLTMILIDAQGSVVSSDRSELVGRTVTHREFFRNIQRYPNPDTLYVSAPFLTSWGNFTMNLTRMVPGPEGGFGGVVVAAMNPEEFRILLKSVVYAPEMYASLIHGEGLLFLSVPERKDLVGFNQERPSSFFTQQIKSNHKANVFSGTSYPLADESLVAMETIRPEKLLMDQPLVVAVGRELPSVYADWRRDVLRNGGLFGIVTLFAVLGLIYYQRQWRVLDNIAADRKEDHRRSLEALSLSEERFRSLTRLSSDWYWEQDDQFRFIRLLGQLDQRTSIVNEAHAGKTRWEMGALNLTEADWEKHRAVLEAHQEFHDFEMQRCDKTGRLYWVSISGAPIFDAQGTFRGYRGVARDITVQKTTEEEIKRQAFYDSLTQLPNRRLFIERIGFALAASKRSKNYGALVFLDLDNFKPLNDIHGHAAGDLLLIEAARRITGCVRQIDTAARFGGDEFAVILGELDTDMAAARSKASLVAEKIRTALAEPYVLKLQLEEDSEATVTHRCTASIGVTLFIATDATQKEILKWSDMAMYQAKADGRNLIRFYDQID